MAPDAIHAETAPPDEAAVADLCARLFTEPDRLDQAVTHAIDHRLYIAPHAHKDLLQFDLMTGCDGSCLIDGKWRRISGLTAMTTYPGDEHGYDEGHVERQPAYARHGAGVLAPATRLVDQAESPAEQARQRREGQR